MIEGKDVFDLYSTHGLPLSESLRLARDGGFRLDMPGFIKRARLDGWPMERVQATLREAFADALGYREKSLNLLDSLTRLSYLDHS